MKQAVPAAFPLAFLLALPPSASAQIGVRLPSLPSVRADVGPLSVSATVGSRGVDVRVDERVTGRTVRRAPSTTRPAPAPAPSRPSRPGPRGATATAAGVLTTADGYLGTPYVWGGTTPRGFDCSGFVQYVFDRHGVALPRTSRQQVHAGWRVPTARHELRPGDLMFFATGGGQIDHVAIYAGDDWIIHSSSSGGGVGYDNLSTRRGQWFASHHVATRRVLADGRSFVADLEALLRYFDGFDPPDRGPRR